MPEAQLEPADGGLAPSGPGWFAVSVADAKAMHAARLGAAVIFEGQPPFSQLGFNVRVLAPGQHASMYHFEDAAEAFLVLRGTCLVVVEDHERVLRAGDFFFSPPGCAHVLVGAGDGPSTIVMAGVRREDQGITFIPSPVAAQCGASVAEETLDAMVAYAEAGDTTLAPLGEIPW